MLQTTVTENVTDIPETSEAITQPPGDDEPLFMRIAVHGKMQKYIKFALQFLEENEKRPLVLHTLPVPTTGPDPPAKQLKKTNANTQNVESTAAEFQEDQKKKPPRLSPCTVHIPRLISIVEVIKRQFVASVFRHNLDHPENPIQLHQYNLVDTLEDETPREQEGSEPIDLELALSGKNHLQVKKTPFMKIILCRRQLPPELVGKASYQEPLNPPKRSRSAKSRDRKRRRKQARTVEAGASKGNGEAIEVDPPLADS